MARGAHKREVSGTSDAESLVFALAWIVAGAIVAARYRDSAVDALPIFHPEHGWDRFVLTRRLSCLQHGDDAPDALGTIFLTGPDAPRLVRPDEEIPLGRALVTDPEGALATALAWCPAGEDAGDHAACWHRHATRYPELYAAVVDLIVDQPGVAAAREHYVDDQCLDGTYHPLYLHSVVTSPGMVYDWFSVETAERSCFFRINGDQAIAQTDAGGWRAYGPLLRDQNRAGMVQLFRSWLRL